MNWETLLTLNLDDRDDVNVSLEASQEGTAWVLSEGEEAT